MAKVHADRATAQPRRQRRPGGARAEMRFLSYTLLATSFALGFAELATLTVREVAGG